MDEAAYARMGEQEDVHWWFSARRENIAKLIDRNCRADRTADILEAGCGSGGNLEFLASFGALDAFEYDENARDLAIQKSGLPIEFGALPDEVPFEQKNYDIVALLDVLEHIENDVPSLKALGQKLTEDGRILITVPAMPWLWSKHDVVHHHFRRYTKRSLRAAVEAAGLEVEKIGYYNFLLFPLAVVKRFADKLTGSESADDDIPARWMNSLFYQIFRLERFWISRIPMPWGLSVFAVVSQPSIDKTDTLP